MTTEVAIGAIMTIAPSFLGSTARRFQSQRWNYCLAGAIAGSFAFGFLVVAVVIIRVVGGLLGLSLGGVAIVIVLMLPWEADVVAGLWVPRVIEAPSGDKKCSGLDSTVSFWHVTSSPPAAWTDGVIWGTSRRPLFGPGLYTWSSFADACRYPKGEPSRGVVRIQLPPSLMHDARTVVIPHKATWQYVRATTWCLLSHHRINPPCLGPGLFCHATDIIIAPAQGMPWASRQWIFRNTPATRQLLREAQIIYYPISWE